MLNDSAHKLQSLWRVLALVIGTLTLAAVCSIPKCAQAQRRAGTRNSRSRPSLSQTIDWLKENLSLQLMMHGNQKLEPVSFQGCTLVWRSKTKDVTGTEALQYALNNKTAESWSDTFETTIRLSEVDPSEVGPLYLKRGNEPPWTVLLSTSSGKSTIKYVRISDTGARTDESQLPGVAFDFRDEESALKVANAFRRAIDLCGGKKSEGPDPNLFNSDPEWKSLGTAGDSRFYLNTRTIKRAPRRTLEVWIKKVLMDQTERGRRRVIEELVVKGLPSKGYDRYAQSLVSYECDCSRRQIRGSSNTDYDETGAVLSTLTYESKWSPVIPDSIAASILKAVCGSRPGPRE